MNKFLFCVLFFALALTAKSQNKAFDTDKLVYGADLGFSISNSYWSLGLSPQVGIRFSQNFM